MATGTFAKLARVSFAFILGFLFISANAEVKIPALTGPVIDEGGFLSSREADQLESLLRSFLPKVQIQIWTLNTLEGDAIESVSIRAADVWKLGTEKKDNGILILVARQERKMRIEIGQGLEGEIPDALAGRIVDQILKPAFRASRFYDGLEGASNFLYQKATGQNPPDLPTRSSRSRNEVGLEGWVFLVLFFIVILVSKVLSVFGFRGPRGPGGVYWGGGGSSWGGGGSSWSGGGGGFSGGGASGNW